MALRLSNVFVLGAVASLLVACSPDQAPASGQAATPNQATPSNQGSAAQASEKKDSALAASAAPPATPSSAAPMPTPPPTKPSLPTAKTRAACESAKGTWSWPGMPHPGQPSDSEGVCIFNTTDAGHACSSSEECQGSCEATNSSASTKKGVCSAHNTRTGCRAYVEKSEVTPVICTD